MAYGVIAAAMWRLAGTRGGLPQTLFALMTIGVVIYALVPSRPAWLSPSVFIRNNADSGDEVLLLLGLVGLAAVATFVVIRRFGAKHQQPPE